MRHTHAHQHTSVSVRLSGGGETLFAATAQWMGLENCGTMLTYQTYCESDLDDAGGAQWYGYRDAVDVDGGFGSVIPADVEGTTTHIYSIKANTVDNMVVARFGAAGNEQVPAAVTVVGLTVQGHLGGEVDLTWNGTSSRYEAIDAALTAYLFNLELQTLSFGLTLDGV